MYELKHQAIELMQTPTGDGKTTVGIPFEYIPLEKPHTEKRIVVMKNGPYLVYGNIPLVRKSHVLSEYGEPLTWRKNTHIETDETYALCRCGHSSMKPFCDGTHARIQFDGPEAAEINTTKERQEVFKGQGIVVKRDYHLCNESGFCGDRFRKILDMIPETDDTGIRVRIMAMIEHCPSGSYTFKITEADEADIERSLPQEIALTTEGAYAGALWVTGEISIERADGQPFETRNRVTLCRCGASKTKPLCDGTHREINFSED
jgi:CDGSH-type Zn-finger protein